MFLIRHYLVLSYFVLFSSGDFLELIIFQHRAASRINNRERKPKRQSFLTEAEMHMAIDQGQLPMIITNSVDENWGFFSTGNGIFLIVMFVGVGNCTAL